MSDESKSETTDLVINEGTNEIQLNNFQQVWRLSGLLVQSGLFGTKNKSEVSTKIITGLEMGISPVRAVRHIDTIEGSPSVSAHLSAAMIQLSENFKYEVEEISVDFNDDYSQVVDGIGRVAIYEWDYNTQSWDKKGVGEFTWGEAVHAGLTSKNNWSQYPRDMLFARAMKRAKRMFCPKVGIGREYSPDELGKETAPTVSVPEEVTEETEPKATEADFETLGESPPEPEEDFTPKKETSETKETSDGEPKEESERPESDNHITMEVTSNNDGEKEVEDEVSPGGESETKETSTKETSDGEPKTGGKPVDEEEAWSEFTKHLQKIDDGLSNLSGMALRDKIGKYHYRFTNDYKDEHYGPAIDMLDEHIDRLKLPYNRERSQVSSPTQEIINEQDRSLQELEDDELRQELNQIWGECDEWSEPARSVLETVLERHDHRLRRMDEPGVNHKAQVAEFNESLSTALTRLGMKMKDTHHFDPLKKLLDALTDKVRSFGPEGYPTEEMIEKYQRAVSPYRTVIQMREAVIGDDIRGEEFSNIVQKYGKSLREWDDREKAQKAHDIVENEAERLEETVDNFFLSWE